MIIKSITLSRKRFVIALVVLALLVCSGAGCRRQSGQKKGVIPRTLRDVPAGRLAYQFTADSEAPPNIVQESEANSLVAPVQKDFDTTRPDDALLRTVISPDRQRVLVLYATGGDEPNQFRLDVYGIGGDLQRHVTPAGLAVVFPTVAAWSPDGNYISFIAFKSTAPQPTPTPFEDAVPNNVPEIPSMSPSPSPVPSVGPVVPSFNTEQIYICNRDGFDLKPLTTREGLIYFYLAWAPDSHGLASLACKEIEWRESPLSPAGRPRLIGLDGGERLLDDSLSDVLPVWSPDSSKVATAVETDVRIYDALTDVPTQAAISLGEALLEASRVYDEKYAAKNATASEKSVTTNDPNSPPISFNPVVTLEWVKPETLYLQTGYVRNFANEQRRTWMRWHLLRLSAQAALLS